MTGRENAQHCELVETINRLTLIEPDKLLRTVSVVHECSQSCSVNTVAQVYAERESTTTDKYFSITHDYHHNLYCINKYAMSFVN